MIGIIILNFNNAEDTIKCIESINRYNTYPVKFIITDNGSTDNSIASLSLYLSSQYPTRHMVLDSSGTIEQLPYISLVKTGRNLGYAGGNNVALKYAQDDKEITKVLVINNDVLFIQDVLADLAAFIDNHADAAIVCPALYKKDGNTLDYNCARKNCSIKDLFLLYIYQIIGRWDKIAALNEKRWLLKSSAGLIQQNYFEIELPSGSCMLIDKELFKTIGYFDSRTFLYYEENILHKKIIGIGKKNYILPDLSCIHLGGSTTRRTVFSHFQKVQICSSAYIYGINYSGMTSIQKVMFFLLYQVLIIKIGLIHYLKMLLKRS